MPNSLYEEDFVIWTRRQAEELRRAAHAGSNLPLDWENLAEEIESLGNRDRRELASTIEIIVAHLIKLAASPAEFPRRRWTEEVDHFRSEVRKILDESPSFEPQLDSIVAKAWRGGVQRAIIALCEFGEYDAAVPVVALWRDQPPSTGQILEAGAFPERGTNRMMKATEKRGGVTIRTTP